jgi:hypothetical protein
MKPAIITRAVRHVGLPVMDQPIRIVYRAGMHADVVARLERAGMVMVQPTDRAAPGYAEKELS